MFNTTTFIGKVKENAGNALSILDENKMTILTIGTVILGGLAIKSKADELTDHLEKIEKTVVLERDPPVIEIRIDENGYFIDTNFD